MAVNARGRGVDEGQRPAVLDDLVRTMCWVMRRPHRHHVGVADLVEQLGLAVVHVAITVMTGPQGQ